MTLAGKTLVVVNLLLSVLFLGLAFGIATTRVELAAELSEKRSIVSGLEQTRAALDKQAKDFQARLKTEQDRHRRIKDENAQQATELQNQIEQLSAERNRLRQEQERLLEEIKLAHGEQVSRRQEVDRLKKEAADQAAEIAKLDLRKADLANQLAQATNLLRLAKSRDETLIERNRQLDPSARGR